jgi:His-Xaa-Ser system radical SAM maturase HxsB
VTAPLDLVAIRPRPGTQAFFRHRPVGDRVLVTGLAGEFLLLTREEFAQFAAGAVPDGSDLHRRLSDANLLRATFDVRRAAERLRARRSFLGSGPNLHIFVVTLRCNETCVYCHASRANMDAVHTDMTPEIAERSVDLALRSTSPFITIEFQGGEPLVNFPVVQHICDYARARADALGKRLQFTMVSNFALLDDAKLEWLVDRRVQLCTSIDGPEQLHNAQRRLPTMDAHQRAVHWIRRVNQRYADIGLDPTLYHVEALLTTTRETLPRWKEVVDTYVDLGCKALFLRPIDPFGFADRTRLRLEYPRSAYLEFYRNAVDYMLELSRQGVQILERYAAIFLTKILRGEDPNFLDLRSPAGAGIGQLAYNYDGKLFTCDEGRMLHEMGDDRFYLGDVRTADYRAVVGHETVRAMVLASNLDGQPDCVNCTYQPYCGTIPTFNHKNQGSIFGRMRESSVCAVHKGIQDYLFEKLAEGRPDVLAAFDRWTTVRPRDHFVQPGPATKPGR